jgi:hypothetical protein
MRFAVSLKRSADPEGEEEWQVKHFSTVRFAPYPSPDTQVSGDYEETGVYPLGPLDGRGVVL